jgi:acetolactate synthase I/II/III large subunit
MSNQSNLMTGAKMLLEALTREGVDTIFGYPGGVTLPFYDALYDNPIRHVLVRHEQNAAFAAQGYARSTGKVGVCCATSGPGATNLVTGLVDAMMDSIPIVALTGQVTSKLIGSDAFQEADTFGITRSATKHNYMVKKVEDLPAIIHEAFYLAKSGRPGPVLVDIPKDVFQGQGHYEPVSKIHLPGYHVPGDPKLDQIKAALKLISESKRPLLYAGGGVIHSEAAAELTRFVEEYDIPTVCTLMGLGALSNSHRNFISMPGMHGSFAANMAMTEADLLIAFGVRFDDRVTGRLAAFAPHARILHVDIDPAELHKNRFADVAISADIKRTLQLMWEQKDLGQAADPSARKAWWSTVNGWKNEHPLEPVFSAEEIKPQHLMHEIDQISGGEAIVTTDVGQHQMWAAQLIRFHHPRLWITSGGLGSMGFGLPSAMGAAFANPDKLTFAIVGDGGFQMSVSELATLASHNVPVKIIVMNNGYLGMVRQWQDLFYNNRLSSVTLDSFPEADKLAGAYGFKGRSINKVSELRSALMEAVNEPGPYLLNVYVSPFENVYPMVPAGGALNEMVLAPAEPVTA